MFFGISWCRLVFLFYWRQMDVFWAPHRTFVLCTQIYYHFYYISILFSLFIDENFRETKNLCVQFIHLYNVTNAQCPVELGKKKFWNMFLLFLIIKYAKLEVKWMLLSVLCIKGLRIFLTFSIKLGDYKGRKVTARFFLKILDLEIFPKTSLN